MDIKQKRHQATQRAKRTRTTVRGTSARPRLSVFRSLRHFSAQLIDDSQGKTLASSSDRTIKATGTPTEVAAKVGEDMAKKAKDAGVTTVVFDRGAYRYHGRVKAFADAARNGGLEF